MVTRNSASPQLPSLREPPPDHHQHSMDMEAESPTYKTVAPLVVVSSDEEDSGGSSRRLVHLYQNVVLDPVGRLLKKNSTDSVECTNHGIELETPPRELDDWTDLDVDNGTSNNMDSVEVKDGREELESLPEVCYNVENEMDKDLDADTSNNTNCLESMDEREELVPFPGKLGLWIEKDVDIGGEENMDCLESIDEREELKPFPGELGLWIEKDVDIGGEDNMVRVESIDQTEELETLPGNINGDRLDDLVEDGNHGSFEIINDDAEEDDLAEMWNMMAMALECSKDIAVDPSADETLGEWGDECHHFFILKDDIGLVCRICGVVQKGIEDIFEFQYSKGKRSGRTYMRESRSSKDIDSSQSFSAGFNSTRVDLMAMEIYAHPRHRNQMKPHQVEGFNFLASNLLTDNPGGCILAHAPGSGKTFLIISFVQSFLARFPQAKPLIVLPKGILATWKKEFQIWQVEDMPLHDFYTSKADNRSQQLDVLEQWVGQKSILFLGYQQFSTIMCDTRATRISARCQEILLKVPSILILDEGHTPRNEDTNMLQSLARVETPLKVVLSGTLYQNHVKEVFNILNLVRPKFLEFDTSRAVVKRIMSRVQFSGVRKQLKADTNSALFDLVEYTLQKDKDFKRKVAVIQDLREMTRNVLHYYKGDSLDELPGIVDFTVLLNLSSRQKLEVEKLKKLDYFKKASVGSLVYMHPELKTLGEKYLSTGEKGSGIDNRKIDKLLEKLSLRDGVKVMFFLSMLGLCESTGEKLLVFSQYILPLKLMERLAMKVKGWSLNKEIFMITGDSNSKQREQSVERFNMSADAKVFLGSIRACGEGISLVGASRVLIMDVQLNPSVTRQAIGRAFRPGQKKKVYVYRLVAADSPEEEDHSICCRKELISKMWFEWNESCGHQNFDMKTVDVNESDDMFLETRLLQEDIKVLQRR